MSFSENLKAIRKEKGLSQEQLAELLDVSRQAVSKWEQEGGYPETEKAIQIAQKLGVSLDFLLLDRRINGDGGKDDAPKRPAAFSNGGKIAVQSYDGDSISSFYKFTIGINSAISKRAPKYYINGIEDRNFWGEKSVILGWYRTKQDAQRELSDIYDAMQNGESAYRLKYNVKVKGGVLLARIDEDEG
jgi:transcriptional regulator with XRE-family HTH domain